ncbi:uncharacterized protein LOC116213373 [Punica granatum]|uniref:Uncharacterized protein LOC116213373 n=1 Tax=Punica granatum TaxID=22663 RepID=A0A6P8EFC5_PUNGR|nr:uncharacterized protein LOC116213373 [Punica granatum]
MTSPKAEKRRRRRNSGGSGSSIGFFKCFRPAFSDDETDHKAGARVPAPSLAEKGRAASLPPPSPAQTDDGCSIKKCRQGLSAGIKAVFFEKSLSKKSTKSKHSKDSDPSSKGKLSSTSESEYSDSMDDGSRRTTGSSALTSSLSLDSSRYSNISSSSRSFDSSQRPSQSSSFISSRRQCSFKEQRSRSDNGLYVLLFITLLVVVFWGKLCAIICTSTMLYITAHRSIACLAPNNVSDATDSAEYKKRIVLGGFLDRKRSRSATISD